MPNERPPSLAAVRYERGFAINPLLAGVVDELRRRGYRIGGLLQQAGSDEDCAPLTLIDIRTGKRAVITQDRGKESAGCRLDPRGLADISHCIGDTLAAGVDLVVINKFGRAESEGAGLLACFAEVVVAGIPLLTTVREPYVEAWRAFHGGYASELPPCLETIVAWCTGNRAAREDLVAI
jgi:hypothetical protein